MAGRRNDNLVFQEEKARQRLMMDGACAKRIREGQWGKMDGMVNV